MEGVRDELPPLIPELKPELGPELADDGFVPKPVLVAVLGGGAVVTTAGLKV
jgi:hypothetical protein